METKASPSANYSIYPPQLTPTHSQLVAKGSIPPPTHSLLPRVLYPHPLTACCQGFYTPTHSQLIAEGSIPPTAYPTHSQLVAECCSLVLGPDHVTTFPHCVVQTKGIATQVQSHKRLHTHTHTHTNNYHVIALMMDVLDRGLVSVGGQGCHGDKIAAVQRVPSVQLSTRPTKDGGRFNY